MVRLNTAARLAAPLVILASALPAQRGATPTPDTARGLNTVVVSAMREKQRRADVSATIDVLNGVEVRLARAAHPAQVLKRVPGVYVSQLSGEGHSMAIRQPITTKPMYLYLEDGIPTRATGFFNHNALYEVNLPQSDGIEVLKGPGTALYGSDAIGGVINVLSRPASAGPSTEATLEGGGYGYARSLLSAATMHGTQGVRVSLNLTRMDGWRADAPYDRESATVRWDAAFANGWSARTLVTGTKVQQRDVLTQSDQQYQDRNPINRSPLAYRRVQALRLSTALERERGHTLWSVTPFARSDVLELLPSWQLTYDPQTWDTRNTSMGLLLKARHELPRWRARVVAGADADFSPGSFVARQAVLRTVGTGSNKVFQSFTVGATHYDYDVTYRALSPYLHVEASPLARIKVDAGVRYDAVDYDYTTHLAALATGAHRVPASTGRSYARVSPKLGFTVDVVKALNVYGSYRSGFRAPSQGQLFQQNNAASTVDLKPVRAGSAEVGLRGDAGRRLSWQVAAYDMRISDDIIAFVSATGNRLATNAGATRHRGVEASAAWSVVRALRVDVAYSTSSQRYVSWVPQAARSASGTTPALSAIVYSGKRIEQAPRELANVLATWTPPTLHGGRLAAEWTHTGAYFMDPSNSWQYGGYDVLSLHANAQVASAWDVFGRVLNVTDRRYAELAAYDAFNGAQYTPGTPRTVYAGLRFAWSK